MSKLASFTLLGCSALIVLAFTFNASPAVQPACMSWADMRQLITGRYGEVEIGGGQVNGSLTVVVFASIEGQTFTIVSRDASNWSCMLAVGSGWEPGANPALPVPETSL